MQSLVPNCRFQNIFSTFFDIEIFRQNFDVVLTGLIKYTSQFLIEAILPVIRLPDANTCFMGCYRVGIFTTITHTNHWTPRAQFNQYNSHHHNLFISNISFNSIVLSRANSPKCSPLMKFTIKITYKFFSVHASTTNLYFLVLLLQEYNIRTTQ